MQLKIELKDHNIQSSKSKFFIRQTDFGRRSNAGKAYAYLISFFISSPY